MIKKKICLLGSLSVGKTSLIKQYVHGIFSEKYLTTVGVKIDRREVHSKAGTALLLIWDINGADTFQDLRPSHLRGSAGFLMVADGTRPATLDKALATAGSLESSLGKLPRLLLLNKCDLTEEWRLDETRLTALADNGWTILRTSAKNGQNVEYAFETLTERLLTVGATP